MAKSIKTIVVDTFTAFQKNELLSLYDKGKPTHDQWKDMGTDIVLFVHELQKRGFTIVGVVGYEGTGKSFGMKTLPSGSNIWFNADEKNPTWKGGKEEYGTKTNPTKFMIIPRKYSDVLSTIDAIKQSGELDDEPIAFLLGHVEDYKSTDGKQRQRLKVLGNLPNKMNIADKFEMFYYTEVVKEGNRIDYRLMTKNNGSNDCRTSEGMHDSIHIPNDFNTIVTAIKNY